MNRLIHILLKATMAAIGLILLAFAPAKAIEVVYEGETSTFAIVPVPGETYSWELYDNGTVDFAVTSGATTSTAYATFVSGNVGPSIQVKWLKPGFYFFKINAFNITGCTNNIKVGIIEVKEALPTAELALMPSEICEGDQSTLEVKLTGKAPWDIKLEGKDKYGNAVITTYTGITDAGKPNLITINPINDVTYTVIEITDANATQTNPSNSVTLTVHPRPQQTPIYLKTP